MKVLQISNKIPYPEKDGGALAINAITEDLLKAGFTVKLLAMNTKKHFIDIGSIPAKFRNERHLETVVMDTSVKPINALASLLRGKSYNISRFESDEFSSKLKEILQKEKFDIVQLEGIYLAPYLHLIRQNSHAPVILRAHNVEWKIWHKLATEGKNKIKRAYLLKLSRQLKKYEEKVINDFDGIATITKHDLDYFKATGCKVKMINIPFGVDISKYTPKETKHPGSLFFIGALDWLPNLQGLDWFLKNIWKKVHAKFPETQFHIAGRKMPESLRKGNHPGVVFHGEIENAKTFMQEYDIMIVPLLAGGGMRVKIIEGMAMGKAVITTVMGIEGIECSIGKDVLVEDSADTYCDAVCHAIKDPKFRIGIGEHGRKRVEEHYNIERISQQLLLFYKDRIKGKIHNPA